MAKMLNRQQVIVICLTAIISVAAAVESRKENKKLTVIAGDAKHVTLDVSIGITIDDDKPTVTIDKAIINELIDAWLKTHATNTTVGSDARTFYVSASGFKPGTVLELNWDSQTIKHDSAVATEGSRSTLHNATTGQWSGNDTVEFWHESAKDQKTIGFVIKVVLKDFKSDDKNSGAEGSATGRSGDSETPGIDSEADSADGGEKGAPEKDDDFVLKDFKSDDKNSGAKGSATGRSGDSETPELDSEVDSADGGETGAPGEGDESKAPEIDGETDSADGGEKGAPGKGDE